MIFEVVADIENSGERYAEFWFASFDCDCLGKIVFRREMGIKYEFLSVEFLCVNYPASTLLWQSMTKMTEVKAWRLVTFGTDGTHTNLAHAWNVEVCSRRSTTWALARKS